MAGETPDQGEGRVINSRYRLLRALGAGGMGRVWLAHDEELACEVAMKEIALPDGPMDAGEPSQRIARARSEARHAARLRGHPHVATVHDVVVHEGLPWIVMEHVPDAVDLQAVVRRSGPLPPSQVARIGLAVLDALTAGHRIGILHRDVKPANILLAPDSSGDPCARVLLTDYGIALQPESREPRLTATAGILGTPGYLAPERARGEPPTPAADLFSLGATLYHAVEGRGPFDRHGEYATLTALLGDEPTPPVRAAELTPVLLGLLVKDPVRRFAPEVVARGLGRVVQGAAGAGFGPPPGTPQTAGTAQTPGTPHTPGPPPPSAGAPQTFRTPSSPQASQASHSPAGGPYDVGGPGTPGSGAPATPAHPSPEPGNPYAQGTAASPYAGSPYAGSGSPTPYAGSGSPTPYAGSGPPPYTGGTQGGPWGPGGGGAGPPSAPGGRKRLALVALVVAAVLVIAGGAWAAVSLTGDDGGDRNAVTKKSPPPSASQGTPSPTGPVLPYGDAVGLGEPLETGDCVQAVWSGTPFRSVPNLGVVDCADDWPDGQVVAVDTAIDHADARAEGAKRCANQSRTIVEALPDAAGYAVVPTAEGFTTAGGGTACLVLGRHAAIGGEVGRFRDAGTNLWVGQMSIGDCWTYEELEEGYEAPLTDCAEPHTDQVVGTVQAPADMSYKKGIDNATKLCGNKFEPTWAPGRERNTFGWVADKDDWEQGFTKVVCTVGRADNGRTTGKIREPGSV
ncbi:serine/threonine protein kinase [Streptomyces lincolnensis]|uniref:non-specific serine/threonine protein kinase n=1 Tax=Streptomyces lincolnensis TaxID=1915 RepID=A0A1B1MEC5_STRLN|nr:serine/threonine-protein kinase [Streptomyces lincolnensis]ANS66924.1 serine/threonine protein kinase [Streptomyces lincolnensis]AXG55796.1 serine/threonine protein kinase [Streptomyces lincolnensis]QMV07719.1 protein kinase [Streptomyces lincolnensis]